MAALTAVDLDLALSLRHAKDVFATRTAEKLVSLALIEHVLIALCHALSLLDEIVELIVLHGTLVSVLRKHSKCVENNKCPANCTKYQGCDCVVRYKDLGD